jgi:hypothetical protein
MRDLGKELGMQMFIGNFIFHLEFAGMINSRFLRALYGFSMAILVYWRFFWILKIRHEAS